METAKKTKITVENIVKAPLEKVWECWTEPRHIIHWNFASDDWQAPHAEIDLKSGGRFLCRMEAKDGSDGFDFVGVYKEIKLHELIAYTLGDGRQVSIRFTKIPEGIRVVEIFEAENVYSVEMQKGGWQAILDNFKKYTEAN